MTADKMLADIEREAIDAARDMGTSRVASLARVMSVLFIYYGSEKIFASGQEPIEACRDLLRQLRDFFEFTIRSGFPPHQHRLSPSESAGEGDIETITGTHYGRLFETFSAQSYWEEPKELLRARLTRNEIDLTALPRQNVLDAGCGGGRYTVAWRLLGARSVTGVDISPINIASARRRVEEAGIDNVSFVEGNVLALPFPDASFDLVFSNGVLHHTVDWKAGIGELLRVMKPGGWGWLYLIEEPGGLYWELIEILREIMHEEERAFARQIIRQLEIPENRIFYMLDHVMAPINQRLTPAEIEERLAAGGAIGIKRLTRGADFDRVERIHRGEPYARSKFGVGENRYVFAKS